RPPREVLRADGEGAARPGRADEDVAPDGRRALQGSRPRARTGVMTARDRRDDGNRSLEYDIDDELAFHRERTVAELIEGGASPGEAEDEARRRFGPAEKYRARLI